MRLIVDRITITRQPIEIPTELLIEIFQYLPPRDIKSVRLTCREFKCASSQFLIDRVYLSAQPRLLEILTAVARHPIFSNYVREVVYDAAHFEECLTDRSIYKETLFNGRNSIGYNGREEPLYEGLVTREGGWRQYKHCYRQQQRVIKTDEDVKRLTDALTLLPNVVRYTITDDAWGGYDGDYCSITNGRYRIPLLPEYDMTMLVPSHWPIAEEDLPPDHGPLWYRGFEVFCRVASSCKGKRLHSLRVDPADWRSGLSHQVFNLSPAALDRASDAFENLITLELCISTHNVEEAWLTTMRTGAIARLLSAARNLEEMWLRFDARCPWLFGDFAKVVGSQTWPKLRCVTLCVMDMHAQEFARFLERHKTTIEVLSLQFVEIGEGNWHTVLTDMRRYRMVVKQIPHFQVLDRIQDNLDDRMTADILRYLQHGGHNPFRSSK